MVVQRAAAERAARSRLPHRRGPGEPRFDERRHRTRSRRDAAPRRVGDASPGAAVRGELRARSALRPYLRAQRAAGPLHRLGVARNRRCCTQFRSALLAWAVQCVVHGTCRGRGGGPLPVGSRGCADRLRRRNCRYLEHLCRAACRLGWHRDAVGGPPVLAPEAEGRPIGTPAPSVLRGGATLSFRLHRRGALFRLHRGDVRVLRPHRRHTSLQVRFMRIDVRGVAQLAKSGAKFSFASLAITAAFLAAPRKRRTGRKSTTDGVQPMRIGLSMLAALGLAVALAPLPAATAQAQALNAAQAEKLTTDSGAARAMIESGAPADVAWSWFIWLNMPLTGGGPKTWESWRQTTTVWWAGRHLTRPVRPPADAPLGHP